MTFTKRLVHATGQVELAEVAYWLEPEPGHTTWSLWRRTATAADAANSKDRTLVCEGVTAFKVEAFDGEKWATEWGWDPAARRASEGIRGLPLLVSVQLDFGDAEKKSGSFKRVLPVMTSVLNHEKSI
jgi:hypothetical protein